MYEYRQLLVNDRRAALVAEAEQERLARAARTASGASGGRLVRGTFEAIAAAAFGIGRGLAGLVAPAPHAASATVTRRGIGDECADCA